MKEILQNAKDFKIIPDNFKSSGELVIKNIDDDIIQAELILADNTGLCDYKKDENVEVFGINNNGLIYFETTITERKDKILFLKTTQNYSLIQRREYSRVKLDHGEIIFKDMPENTVVEIRDISAGGVKLITKTELQEDVQYDIEIRLTGNMKIECMLQPIRVEPVNNNYVVSGKFINLENIDRIVLVQYVFKKKMENQTITTENNE